MTGKNSVLYRRMLDEIAEYVRFADESDCAGGEHPVHHMLIEIFEAPNNRTLMGMSVG